MRGWPGITAQGTMNLKPCGWEEAESHLHPPPRHLPSLASICNSEEFQPIRLMAFEHEDLMLSRENMGEKQTQGDIVV